MTRKPYEQGRIFMGRLPQGADIVAAITKIANEEGIKAGVVQIHGVVERATLTAFDTATRMTTMAEREGGMEIAAMSGTISQFKGRSMARLSGVLAFADGSTIGGTIGIGTVAHACEAVITELLGGTLTRDFDMETGLPLWKESSLLLESPRPAGSSGSGSSGSGSSGSGSSGSGSSGSGSSGSGSSGSGSSATGPSDAGSSGTGAGAVES